MTDPHLSRLATDLLREEPLVRIEASADDDARAIHAIEEAMLAVRRKRRAQRVATGGALAAAAAVALFVGVRMLSHGSGADAPLAASGSSERFAATGHSLSEGVTIVRDGHERPLDSTTSVVAHDRILTGPTGRMSLGLGSGTHLVVGASSDFEMVERGPTLAFALNAGSVRADVAKLHAGERFLVRTPDGEVEVRGTSFEVDVVQPSPSCGKGSGTRVIVTEGVVTVRSANGEDSVRKGESWPRDCFAATAPSAASPTRPPVGDDRQSATSLVAPALSPTHALSPTSTLTPTPLAAPPASPIVAPSVAARTAPLAPATTAPDAVSGSDLPAQNALFGAATAARRRGDTSTAIATYERFIAQYPMTPLAENAYVERMRLLASSDARRGADAARAYLARYPRGFAAAEAREIAAKDR